VCVATQDSSTNGSSVVFSVFWRSFTGSRHATRLSKESRGDVSSLLPFLLQSTMESCDIVHSLKDGGGCKHALDAFSGISSQIFVTPLIRFHSSTAQNAKILDTPI
jgi:hypothetical protein